MLDLDRHEEFERAILGSFSENGKLAKKVAPMCSVSMFSSQYRRVVFINILNAIKKGFEPTREMIWKGMLSTEEERVEMSKCLLLSSIPNLYAYVRELQMDVALNDCYQMGQKIQDMVVDEKSFEDIFKFTTNRLINIAPQDIDDFSSTMHEAVQEIESKEIAYKEYYIGWEKWDKICPVTPQSISIIAGNEGTFKTKFMIFLTRILMSKYDNIAVKWYSMEDPRDKLIRGFISQDTFLKDKEIRTRDNYTDLLNPKVAKFDIEFVNKSCHIKEIGEGFRKFREKRPGKFCILIVDNIMKIHSYGKAKGLDLDEEIIREIDTWNIKTDKKEASVYLLHHFTKEAMDAKNEYKGYEPNISMMRGGGRYKDTCTHVFLFNAMYSYPSIVRLFEKDSEMIKHLLLMHLAKNRNDEKETFRSLVWPAFNFFSSI